MSDTALTPERELFAQSVASGMNQSDAYRLAFGATYAPSAIASNASILMSDANVRQRVAELRQKAEPIIAEQVGMTLADTVRAFVEIALCTSPEMERLLALGLMGDDVRALDKVAARRIDALDKLMRHLGGYPRGITVQDASTTNNLVLQGLPDDRIAALAALADKIRSES